MYARHQTNVCGRLRSMNLLYCCNSGARSALETGRPTSGELVGRAACDKRRCFIHTKDVTRDTFMSYVSIVQNSCSSVNMFCRTATQVEGRVVDIMPNTSPIVSPKEGVINGTDIHE